MRAQNNVLHWPDRRALARPAIDPREVEIARANTERSCAHDRERICRLIDAEVRQQRIQHWTGIFAVALLILAGVAALIVRGIW